MGKSTQPEVGDTLNKTFGIWVVLSFIDEIKTDSNVAEGTSHFSGYQSIVSNLATLDECRGVNYYRLI